MIGLAIMAAVSPSTATIPARYVGKWTTDAAIVCGDEDTNGVDITPNNIAFYEAGGKVRGVVAKGDKGADVRVDFVGEGREWAETVRLSRLPHERLRMTAMGQTFVLARCRGAKSQ